MGVLFERDGGSLARLLDEYGFHADLDGREMIPIVVDWYVERDGFVSALLRFETMGGSMVSASLPFSNTIPEDQSGFDGMVGEFLRDVADRVGEEWPDRHVDIVMRRRVGDRWTVVHATGD